MKKKIAWFIFLMIIAMGIDYELGAFIGSELSSAQFLQLMCANLYLLIYLIPFGLGFLYVARKWHYPKHLIGAVFFSCLFLSGWLAALGNDGAVRLFDYLFGKSILPTDWLEAILVPFVEEFLKFSATYLVIYLFGIRGGRHIFLSGILSGLAFQFVEDIDYIGYQAMDDPKYIFQTALERASGGFASHWIYTGLFVIAVYQLYRVLRKQTNFQVRFIIWFFVPVLSHILWNSPLPLGPYNCVTALITAFTLMAGLDVYQWLEHNRYPYQ